MDTSGNGHRMHDGLEHLPEGLTVPQGRRFGEDELGATLDSGDAICRFNTQRGGRLERWIWRTNPPTVLHSKTGPPLPEGTRPPRSKIELVDPTHGALIDHFLPLGTRPDEFAAGQHREFGDFTEEPFRSQVVDSGGEIRIGLLRDGAIRAGTRVAEVRMAKSAALRPGSSDLAALYRVINSSPRPLQILFAVELNLYAPGLSGPTAKREDGYYLIDGQRPEGDYSFASSGVSPNCTHLALVNPAGEMALQVGWDREADLWRMPGPEGNSGVRLLAVWRLQLPPRDNWAMGLWMAPG